jgi:sphinganine C4-monooxygenase
MRKYLKTHLGNIHSVHHRNYVPYSYAASYNHPIEGFFNDILGAYVASAAIGLTEPEMLVFFSVASVKAVDDHSGLLIPFNPIRLWALFFKNGLVHHNIHHQVWGLKVSTIPPPRVIVP